MAKNLSWEISIQISIKRHGEDYTVDVQHWIVVQCLSIHSEIFGTFRRVTKTVI